MRSVQETRLLVDAELDETVCQRAVIARDPRFDGLFFVGITTTRIYCRPVCPARVVHADRRRFFKSAAAAERAGYRPCLRCRPELAPGRALCDAVSRLASAAANRIAAGALNGRSVAALARELCVSERHLRRALEREFGVAPLELAQTHRLLLAKRLLADTNLPVTRIAFASGFQSVRRFNSTFHDQYRLTPTALRRSGRTLASTEEAGCDLLRLTLAYRRPLDWAALLAHLRRDALAGVETFDQNRYGRTVDIDGKRGVVFIADTPPVDERHAFLTVDVSTSLVPVLMPLLARIRQLLDLDAEPLVIDSHLRVEGLSALVDQHPGLRVPGALDGFEVLLRLLLANGMGSTVLQSVVTALGDAIDTSHTGLHRLSPNAARVAEAGSRQLARLGVAPARAEIIVRAARAVLAGELRLEPGARSDATRALLAETGVSRRIADNVVMRALHWPDAFPASDRGLQRAAGVQSEQALLARAAAWRPWRAYAALHLLSSCAPLRPRARALRVPA